MSGRLIATSSGFTNLGSSPDIGYSIVADTSYTVELSATRSATGEIVFTTDFLGNSYSVVDAAPLSYDFGLLAFGSSSGAFGSSNSPGDPDNGIDITNVSVTFVPVPEPSSVVLCLLGGLVLLLGKRRR
jgi:hypothetical protein